MSLGCLSGTDDLYHSYVEFTPRDHETATDESKILAIHERWQDWLLLQDSEHPGLAEAINTRSAWEYREFSLRGNEPQFLIAVFHRDHNEKTHAQLLEWFERFLREADQS